MERPHFSCPLRLMDPNYGMYLSPKDLSLPYLGANYFRPWNWRLSDCDFIKDVGSKIDISREFFKVTLDVQHFKPDELSVKVRERDVIIEGDHEERRDDHGFVSRKFSRRYVLPNDYAADTVTSSLSSDGILTITANRNIDTNAREKVVPIKLCGTCPLRKGVSSAISQINNTEKKNEVDKIIQSEDKIDKNKCQIMLKEEHCCLMKPELLLAGSTSKAEKTERETRKELDELLNLTEKIERETLCANSGLLEEQSGQFCSTKSSAKASDKFEQSNASYTSEKCKSKIRETMECQETSSSFKSMSAAKKSSSEKHEILSDIISAELREAAENI